MKTPALNFFLFLFVLLGTTQLSYSTSYQWVGNTSTDWATGSNWSPTGIPDSADHISVSSGTYNLVLDQNRRVSNLTLSTKTINLNGHSLTVYGTATMTSGTVTGGNFIARGSLAAFNGTLMDCPVDAVCGYIRLSGSTFNETADFADTGTATGTGTGGCTFNDDVTITHGGTLTYFTLANTNGDTFNGNVTFTNNSNRELYVATNGSTQFNGNIILNSTSTGGILFGNGTGTSTLASGKTVSIGASGFAADFLTLKNFTQSGSTAQSLTLTGSAAVNMIGVTFNGNLIVSAPGFLMKNSVFNATSSFTKSGTGNHQSDGGNTFNGATTIAHTGASGRIRMATITGDTYNADVTFNSSGQDVQVAYLGNNSFMGNITINSNKVVFNTSTGKVTFTGTNNQTLNGSYNYPFKKLSINKTSGTVTANTTLSVDDSLIFIQGNLITTSTNLLTMKHGSTATSASNNSFVDGPVKKTGSSTFVFPVGNKSIYRPIGISATSSSTNEYIAQFWVDSLGINTGNRDSTLGYIKRNQFWNLTRSNGTSQVYATLSWDSQYSFSDTSITIANWNGTKWIDIGKGAFTGSASAGTLTSFLHVQNYSQLALSYRASTGSALAGCSNITTATGLQTCLNGAGLGSVLTVTGDIILDGNNLTFPLQVHWGVTLQGSTEWWKPGCPLISSTQKNSYADANCCNDDPPCPQGCHFENLFLFEMEDNSAIRNLRIRGGSCNYQDFNNDDMLCGGIYLRFVSTPTSLATVENCEISCFSYAGIFGKSQTDGINIVNNYIHKVKGTASTGIGYGSWMQGQLTVSRVDFENNIFDDCKAAIDGQGYPTDWYINKCTFSQFFISEDINKHNDNKFRIYHVKNGTVFNDHHICYGSTCADALCFYNISCPSFACNPPYTACTSGHLKKWMNCTGGVPIYDVGGANTYITNNIFHRKNKESDSNITLTFPNRDTGTGYGGNSQNGIFINDNTFVSDDDDPANITNNLGGFARIADNYIRACVWQGDAKIECLGNEFSYVPGKPITTQVPQEFTMYLTNNAATASLPFSHTLSTLSGQAYMQVVDVNTAFKLNITPEGATALTYLIRPNAHSNTLPGGQLISNENYFYNGSYISTSNTGNPIGAYDKAGLYGIDVMALDANAGSSSTLSPYNFKASSWKHIPVIVKETAEQILYFNVKDSYIETLPPASATNIFKQAYFNDLLIWSEDVADGGDGWEYVRIDLDGFAADGTTLIKSVVHTDGTDNIISFSIATGNNTTLVNGEIVRGISVWIDDVYIKKYGNSSGDNLIRDGSIELSENGLSNWPPTMDTYWSSTVEAPGSCTETPPPPASQVVHEINYNTNVSRAERKSGQFALRMTADPIYECDMPIYPASLSSTTFLRLTTIGTAIDFTDFLSCSEYSGYSAIDYYIDANTPYQNQNLFIDGNVEIISGGTLNLQGCRIVVKPHSPPYTITVKSGGTLIMDEFAITSPTGTTHIPTHIFACDEMWGGIINEGGTLDLYAAKSAFTKIEDAIIAIESEGGNVQVRYTTFDHNGTGIVLDGTNIAVNSSSRINGCEFLCTDGVISRTPLTGTIPNEHVILNGITNFNFPLGTSGSGTGTLNIFSDAINGVSISNSKVIMQRNEFYRIYRRDDWNLATDYGRAINIRNSGTSTNYATIITNNKFNDVNLGINVDNIIGSELTIYENTFNNPNYNFDPNPSTVLFYNHRTAIKVQNPIASPAIKAEIYGNTITDFRIGIHAVNVEDIRIGTDILGNPVRNTVAFNRGAIPAGIQYHAGILLQSCTAAHVTGGDNNSDPDIHNDIEVATLGVTEFRGIDIENSPDVRLNCNVIKNISNSITFTGNCFGTLMRKNYVENFEVGVNNFHSIVGNQGLFNGSTWEKLNNQWVDVSSTQFRVGGIIDQPFNWYHQSGSTYTPSPNSGNIFLIGSSAGNPPCTDYTPQMRDELYSRVVGDSLIFEYFEEENTYLVKTSSFERMKRDTSILYEGRSTDADFQNYFLLNDSTSIGILSEVRVLSLDSFRIDEAIDANEEIDDEIGIETFMKTVYGIYLNTIAVGLPLSATDSTTLEEIALKTWIEAGNAIYIAANMLGMEIHSTIPELRLSNNITLDGLVSQPTPNQISIHPNPATNSLTISGLGNNKSTLQIFDMQGKLVFNKEVSENATIDISNLIIGIYRINAIANGTSSSFKFVKIKY